MARRRHRWAAAVGCCCWLGEGESRGQGAAPVLGEEAEDRGPFRCGGFFTVLASEWERDETCSELFARALPKLRVLSAQMADFGARLTVFATRGAAERLDPRCQLDLPGLEVADFNSSALLARHGFPPRLVSTVRAWRFGARKQLRADIFRLCLALETGLSYVDTDILFLASSARPFLSEYLAATVWASSQASLEITNAAFCLGPSMLERMIAAVRGRIESKGSGQAYFYTELGAHIFQRTALNAGPIRLLSHNHPEHWDTPRMLAQHREYGHQQMHLTGAIRQFSADKAGEGYLALVRRVRRVLGLPPLQAL